MSMFCLTVWSFTLTVRLLYLGMCTSHLLKISYFLVMCSYHLVQRSFYLVIRSCHSVMYSFHYLLFYAFFLCTLIICSFNALFVFALFMRSFHVLFVYVLFMSSFAWYENARIKSISVTAGWTNTF